jgi:hypothetical protein
MVTAKPASQDQKPVSVELRAVAKRARDTNWHTRFLALADRVQALEEDQGLLSATRERADSLAYLLATRDAEEDKRRRRRWSDVGDLINELHRALGHAGGLTLCSDTLCRQATRLLEDGDAHP